MQAMVRPLTHRTFWRKHCREKRVCKTRLVPKTGQHRRQENAGCNDSHWPADVQPLLSSYKTDRTQEV